MPLGRATRKRFKLLVDLCLLVAGFLTLASSLVLFFCFHMGDGPTRASAAGVARITWLNLHRLSALPLVAAVVAHIALHWRVFVGRLRRSFSRLRRRGGPELLLYLTFWTVAVIGLVVWLFVDGSTPIGGPVRLARLTGIRHRLVDVHNIVGLVALVLTVHHVGHRWRGMVRRLTPARRRDNRVSAAQR